MKLYSKTVLSGCLILILASCVKDVQLDYSAFKPGLVIQGQLTPDTTFAVTIAATLSPNSTTDYRTPDGTEVSLIDVTGTGGEVINLTQNNNKFVSANSYPVIGHSYKVFVNAPGFPTAEATTSIPDADTVRSGEVVNLRIVPSASNPNIKNVSYDLNLNFGQFMHQYYHLRFIQTLTVNLGSSSEPNIQQQAYFIEPQLQDQNGYYAAPHLSTGEQHETGVLIDVSKLTGTSLKFSFLDPHLIIFFPDGTYTVADDEKLGNLYIEIRTVTPEYFLYYTSLARQLISRDDPFAEPIPVYNNIKQGMGNFAGYNSKVYYIKVIP